jgi:hypothetical protein
MTRQLTSVEDMGLVGDEKVTTWRHFLTHLS